MEPSSLNVVNGSFQLETAYIDGTPVPVCTTCGSIILRAYINAHMEFHRILTDTIKRYLDGEA